MPEQNRPESADLTDYEVLDASDTLDGDPGDDPLDRGIATPQRWSAAIRQVRTAVGQPAGEPLEQRIAEEEPDVDGPLADSAPDPRAGRLVAEDEGAHPDDEVDLVARDAGIDGGGATAEEAAIHVVNSDDTDIGAGG